MTTERYVRVPDVAGSGECAGSRVTPVRPQAAVGNERHAVALTAVPATTARPGAPIDEVHVATGADVRRAPGNRQGRRGFNQEAPAAQCLTARTAHRRAGRFNADAVIARLLGNRLVAPSPRQHPEKRGKEADCYGDCY